MEGGEARVEADELAEAPDNGAEALDEKAARGGDALCVKVATMSESTERFSVRARLNSMRTELEAAA